MSSIGYAFALPYLLLLAAFGVIPSVYAAGLSLFKAVGAQREFAGVANYVKVLGDFRFLPAWANVIAFLLIWLPLMTIGVVGISLLLHMRLGRVSTTMRMIYYLPGAIAGSASVLVWLYMLSPDVSPFGPLLEMAGISDVSQIIRPGNFAILFAVIVFTTGAGGWIVIMHGGLQSIPLELMEAAAIDGANELQIALHVKLPLIRPYVVYMLILSVAAGIQIFVEPTMMNQVGASSGGSSLSPWWSVNQLGFTYAFQQADLGTASAISIELLSVCLVLALILVFRTHFYDVGRANDE